MIKFNSHIYQFIQLTFITSLHTVAAVRRLEVNFTQRRVQITNHN